ncbi:hypothetical protein SAMN06272755_0485 [Picosynechococcus sp. OG1]|nr:hypothetical protein SAMN06272755_0485 [Picosynechococcus sp. OG1]SMQ84446.1 hypothetical protein SAMN06272774_2861 [Synechococcus sp. 7002]
MSLAIAKPLTKLLPVQRHSNQQLATHGKELRGIRLDI